MKRWMWVIVGMTLATAACGTGGGSSGLDQPAGPNDVDVAVADPGPISDPGPLPDNPVPPPDTPKIDVPAPDLADGISPPDDLENPDSSALPLGAACDGDRQCQSGFCADSVCCDQRCATACRTCSMPGAEGTCSFQPAGSDPDGDCAACSVCSATGTCQAAEIGTDPKEDCEADTVASCGQNGDCNGVGECALYPDATPCAPGQVCEADAIITQACRGGICVPVSEPCAPYSCGGATQCGTDCDPASGQGCAAGNYACNEEGQCVGILPNGTECELGAECSSSHCVDGVCCETACDGTCETCNLQNQPGSCRAIAAGSDPDADCGEGLCAGTCNGTRACEFPDDDVQCGGVAPCNGRCDGAGQCLFPGSESTCGSCQQCDGSGACRAVAAGQDPFSQCGAGQPGCLSQCDGAGGCVFPVDAPCGTCQRCDATGSCTPVWLGEDPFDQCPDEGDCGFNGVCDGQGACQYDEDGTVCGQSQCSDAQLNLSACLGHHCQVTAQDCGGYVCAGPDACATTCGNDADCADGYHCEQGACLGQLATGEPCLYGQQCDSGFCADGVCCESACDGLCETCNLIGQPGICDPQPANIDPDDECAGLAACDGTCDGLGACQFPDELTACGGCQQCDGNGNCSPVPAGADPFDNCQGQQGLCAASCDGIGGCTATPDPTVACGTCQQCDGQGNCGPVAEGSDPFDECPGDESPCGTACDGAGDCQPLPLPPVSCGTCQQCDGQGQCVAIFGSDPNQDCDDNLSCTDDVCQGSGTCQFPQLANTCLIAGVCFAADAANPANECQVCRPGVNATNWSAKTDGSACSADLLSCTQDTCQSGTCSHAPTTDACLIGGTCYGNGAANPANDCQSCQPTVSQSAWTNKANGATCSADSLSCTTDVCQSGSCAHPLTADSCLIGGSCYSNGTVNPSNECQSCQPSASQSAWTNKTNGSACAADTLSCTADVCSSGSCTHPLNADACLISGSCYASGAANPTNDCQSCQPTTSQSAWTSKSNGSPCTADLLSCTADVCAAGSCTHPYDSGSNQCLIGGSCYTSGAGNPANECQSCQPAVSGSAWSAKSNGTACTADNYSCTSDVCQSGSCSHPVAQTNCLIGNVCYASAANNPANECQSCQPTSSQTAWTNKSNGTSCTADNYACTTDVCQTGACSHPIAQSNCLISSTCYASAASNPANDCQSCQPTTSQTAWTNKASGSACATDHQSCTTDACNAGGSCLHTALPDWQSCDDGLTTTYGDLCASGICRGFGRALGATSYSPTTDEFYLAARNANSGGVHAIYGTIIPGTIPIPVQYADRFSGSTTPADSGDQIGMLAGATSDTYISSGYSLETYDGSSWVTTSTVSQAWAAMPSQLFSAVSNYFAGALVGTWSMHGAGFNNNNHAMFVRTCGKSSPFGGTVSCTDQPSDASQQGNWKNCVNFVSVPYGGTVIGNVSYVGCEYYDHTANWTYDEYPHYFDILKLDSSQDPSRWMSQTYYILNETTQRVRAMVWSGAQFVTVGMGNVLTVTNYTIDGQTFGTHQQVSVTGFGNQSITDFEAVAVWRNRVWVIGHYLSGSGFNQDKVFVLVHAPTSANLQDGSVWTVNTIASYHWPCAAPCASGANLSQKAIAGDGNYLYLFGGWYNSATDQMDRAVWMLNLP